MHHHEMVFRKHTVYVKESHWKTHVVIPIGNEDVEMVKELYRVCSMVGPEPRLFVPGEIPSAIPPHLKCISEFDSKGEGYVPFTVVTCSSGLFTAASQYGAPYTYYGGETFTQFFFLDGPHDWVVDDTVVIVAFDGEAWFVIANDDDYEESFPPRFLSHDPEEAEAMMVLLGLL